MPLCIILGPDLEKWSLCHSGLSIRLCARCQYLCQHIFDHHSSIFSADVALDKHCMTSNQNFWCGTKLPQGHWRLLLLTNSALLCKFLCPPFLDLHLSPNYFITIHFGSQGFVCFALDLQVIAAWEWKSLTFHAVFSISYKAAVWLYLSEMLHEYWGFLFPLGYQTQIPVKSFS